MKNFGLVHLDHVGVFVAAGVAGNVQRADAVDFVGFVAEDVHALFEQVVDHVRMRVVAGVRDRRAGQDDGVLFFELDVAVLAVSSCAASAELGSPWLNRYRLRPLRCPSWWRPLAIGTKVPFGIFMKPWRTAISSVLTMLRPSMATFLLWWTAALMIIWTRFILVLEQADENAARRLVHDVDEALFDGRFAGRAAEALGGGHSLSSARTPSLPSSFSRSMSVRSWSSGLGSKRKSPVLMMRPTGVSSTITGTARNGVRDPHQLHEEFADFQAFVGVFVHGDGLQLKAVGHRQAEVLEDFFDPANGKLAAVNRRRELRHDVRQAADVVQVAVGNDVGPQLMLDLSR